MLANMILRPRGLGAEGGCMMSTVRYNEMNCGPAAPMPSGFSLLGMQGILGRGRALDYRRVLGRRRRAASRLDGSNRKREHGGR